MPMGPNTRFTNDVLIPAIEKDLARTDTIRLPAGSYPKGTALGQVTLTTAQNDVQTLTFASSPAGSFVLRVDAFQLAPVTYSATPATLQANLQAAFDASLGAGAVTVNATSATNVTVTFDGTTKAQDPGPILVVAPPNAGGTLTVARTTVGRSAGGMYRPYASGNSDGSQGFRCVLKRATTVDVFGRHTHTTGHPAAYEMCVDAYFRGCFSGSECPGVDTNAVTTRATMHRGSTTAPTAPGAIFRLPG